ncbi:MULTISPECIES: amidohydrolase [unclassified Sphingomonas]|uniref:amidohydrolase n=1 Tax=unclassified Sphingomonas TaxID=196159 RepID=UPI0006FEE1A4|nr:MULTISPECIES: amidohydrolase [unclassified Sphingomonas]KQM28667.1 metal-dependent hydrolase [Sphingomonas sp. Leaf9]KQM45370.1 metal-dependent hydrolase [Sphingomonas sp. Leaf11]
MRRAALTLAALLLAGTAQADGLIDNVNGVALDSRGQVVRFGGILVDKDGKVVRLVPKGEKAPKKLDWRSDMAGKIVMPGMIDAHGHVMSLGYRALELDLSTTKSLSDAQSAIQSYARSNGNRQWILGGGWNQEAWGLGRFPTAAELDAAAGDKPVLLERADGHAVWANSAAMKAAGITAKTVAPAGGRIELLPNGQPSGVFVDNAASLFDAARPKPSPRERNAAFLKAQELLLSTGITATADMGTSVDDWIVFRRMGDIGQLRVRIMSYAAGLEPALTIAGAGPTPWLYGDRLRMGGIKLYADGALGSRGAWLKAPYSDAPKQTGLSFINDTTLLNLLSRGTMDGFQFAIHAIGDRANRQVLDAIDELASSYKDDRRWRIEHAQVLDPADLPRLGKNGIIASMQPVHATGDRTMAEARLGPARLAGAYAWATVLRDGGRLAFGSDYPVENPNPFVGWAAALTREDANGQPPGGWRPEEKVTREQAWKAFTQDAAFAGFAEQKFGSLLPGQKADFIVVDRDPVAATPADLRATRVIETWVGGYKAWPLKDVPKVDSGR